MGQSFDLQICHPSLSDEAGHKKRLTASFIYLWLWQFVIESKQRRFLSDSARQPEVENCTLEPWFWTNFWANPLYKNKTLGNTNMVESRLIKREKGSLPVDVSLKNFTAWAPYKLTSPWTSFGVEKRRLKNCSWNNLKIKWNNKTSKSIFYYLSKILRIVHWNLAWRRLYMFWFFSKNASRICFGSLSVLYWKTLKETIAFVKY